MRRISANYIYQITNAPLKNGIVEIDEKGEIKNIIDTKGDLRESRNLEFYNGVITPGFVNTHCHLELSGLKGLIEQNSGLPKFLSGIIQYKRNDSKDSSFKAIEQHDFLMRQRGIVAVGDISNTDRTIKTKKKSRIFYHTFIEAIGLASNSKQIFELNKKLVNDFSKEQLSASISPHAPYSVSKDLFLKIKEFSENQDSIITIHNQETESENQMFINKSGDLVNAFQGLGIELKNWESTGRNSLESIVEYLPKSNHIIFVHNTFSSKEDIKLARENFQNAYWCLCPNSNLYIENRLPDLDLFHPLHEHITLGTDSLASNSSLSILDEMKTITKNYKKIEFDKLIKWATWNGAKALKIEKTFGSIEIGKSPGLNLINNFDFDKMQITQNSEIKVLC